MLKKIADYIKVFLDNTPSDIYEFSVILEDALVTIMMKCMENSRELQKYWQMKSHIYAHQRSRE